MKQMNVQQPSRVSSITTATTAIAMAQSFSEYHEICNSLLFAIQRTLKRITFHQQPALCSKPK